MLWLEKIPEVLLGGCCSLVFLFLDGLSLNKSINQQINKPISQDVSKGGDPLALLVVFCCVGGVVWMVLFATASVLDGPRCWSQMRSRLLCCPAFVFFVRPRLELSVVNVSKIE